MEYVKHIYIYIYLCWNNDIYWNNVMYTNVLELRFLPAASCKAYCVFLIIFHFYMILYICILLCHIYKKNNTATARVGHLHNPYCIRIVKLTRGHSSSRCRSSIELTKIFRIMQILSGAML